MILPVPVAADSADAQDPTVDMKVAIKLLSGKDCRRDPSQAQVLLLRLAEGKSALLADDATRILKAGARNDWFGEKAPHYWELERIAEKSLARKSSSPQLAMKMTLAGGLIAVLLGLVAFYFVSGGGEIPARPMVVGLIILGLFLFTIVQRYKNS